MKKQDLLTRKTPKSMGKIPFDPCMINMPIERRWMDGIILKKE